MVNVCNKSSMAVLKVFVELAGIELDFAELAHQADELKSELDRLGVFDEYEDRFLDLFQSDD